MEQEDIITAANNASSPSVDTTKSSSGFQVGSTSGTKSNKQKMKKVEWTPQLHSKFVEAVEQLGVDQAVPSRILKFMRVEGLTRQNIASHLQKYRTQRRQSLSQPAWSNYYPQKHVIAFPINYHSNYNHAAQFGPTGVQMMLHADVWGYPAMPPSLGSTPSYPQLHTDVWGYPVMPPSLGSTSNPQTNASGYYSAEADWMQNNMRNSIPEISFDVCPGEEMIDKVVNEVLSKPWLPLPLGLKPPPTDTIQHEFQPTKGSHHRP